MTEEAKLTALLHVSAVITVLTLAFLGLDSSHIEDPNYKEGIEKAKGKAKAVMMRLGLSGQIPIKVFGGSMSLRLKTTCLASVICLIAEEPIDLNVALRIVHFAHRQVHIPLFGYFRDWDHDRIVSWMARFSTAVFLGSAATVLWNSNWYIINHCWFAAFSPDWILEFLFGLLALCLLWLMISGTCMRFLSIRALDAKIDELEMKITDQFKLAKQKEQERIKRQRRKLRMFKNILENELNQVQRRLDSMGDD